VVTEFRKFIARGNVVDLAVGVVIGAAFAAVVKSFVDDILMPPIGRLTGGVDFSELFISLDGHHYATRQAAEAAGAATVNYGVFLSSLISFLLIAFAVFLLVKAYERIRRSEEVSAPTGASCPFCTETVAPAATRCPHCTSHLDTVPALHG
jgi:large conductance mechanosensitive channel